MATPMVQNLFDLSGQVVLITGGTGYLGSSFSNALAEAGASVIISSRVESHAQMAAAELPVIGTAQHYGIVLDQKNETSIQSGFESAIEQAGKIDILINNGQSGAASDLTDVTADQFNDHLENVTGYFLLARQLHDHVQKRNAQGSIVMIGSMYGTVGSYPDAYAGVCPASSVAYHTLKGGVIHLTRHLAVYWAQDRVRVNCLSPGPFPAPEAPREMVERLCTKSPMNRMGVPQELNGALLLLASKAGSYITGQNLIVDGGWTAW